MMKLKKKNLSKEDALEIYKEMYWIRLYESFLDEIKIKSEWNGIKYGYYGPAHMSTGQEGAAVGHHFAMDKDDIIMSSHRNHGEVISKGLSAIYKMNEDEFEPIMKEYNNGEILAAIEKTSYKFKSIREKNDFLLYLWIYVWSLRQSYRI